MFNLNLLMDAAKDRQAELVHEAEMTRINRIPKSKRTANSFAKKLRILLSSNA